MKTEGMLINPQIKEPVVIEYEISKKSISQ